MPANTYWNMCGKYQEIVTVLSTKVGVTKRGSWTGITELDAFTGMCNIYYDVYNNGYGWNNEKLEKTDLPKVRALMGSRFGCMKKFYNDFRYLESCINKVLLKIYMSKLIMTRTVYIVNINGKLWGTPSIRYLSGYTLVKVITSVCEYSHVKRLMSTHRAEFLDVHLGRKKGV